MLSGARLRGSRTKRAEKYVNEEADSMAISDADSIKVFFENTPTVSIQSGRKTSTKENPSPNIKNCDAVFFEDGKLTRDLSTDVLEERIVEQNHFATNTTFRSSRKTRNPAFLIEDREPCFSAEITTTLSRPPERKNDLFDTNANRIHRINNTGRVDSRLRGNLSQTNVEEWELGNKNDRNESNFKFTNSTNKSEKNYNDSRHIRKTSKDESKIAQDDLVFSDIFADKAKNTISCTSSVVENWLQLQAKRQQTLRRVRSQPHSIVQNRTKQDSFTDLSLSEESSSDKSTLREFPWGTNALEVLHPVRSTIRDKHTGKSRPRSSPPGERTVENRISEEEPQQEDPSELMEDSKDMVNKLNNSEGDKFSDEQGERSFVCLVDQLTDVRVRQKFEANYAGRRRHAVCEELEKVWVWNDRCLYEYRRDLNVRTALSNMFS